MSKWISVKAWLPEPTETVLLYECDGFGFYQYWFGQLTSEGKFKYYKGIDLLSDKDFSFWMPLPEPPILISEEENEKA